MTRRGWINGYPSKIFPSSGIRSLLVIASAEKQPKAVYVALGCFSALAMTKEVGRKEASLFPGKLPIPQNSGKSTTQLPLKSRIDFRESLIMPA
jgi:hypothetical protein